MLHCQNLTCLEKPYAYIWRYYCSTVSVSLIYQIWHCRFSLVVMWMSLVFNLVVHALLKKHEGEW